MPLRALLLPPEQPSTSGFGENNGAYNTLKLSVSTPAPSPRSSHARLDGYDYLAEANASANFEAQRGTSWSNVRKRLPQPGQERERDPDQRASNQTYKTNLTLPTTSGTDHVPSPPLSPASSAISTRTSLRQNTVPLETDARGRPKLKVETKIPKVGTMVRYKHDNNDRHQRGSLIESPVGTSKWDAEDEIPSGEKTAREAVDARLQHLIGSQPQVESIPPVPPLPSHLSISSNAGVRQSTRRSTSKDRRSKQSSTSRLSSTSNAPNVSDAASRPPLPVRKPSAVPPPSPVGLPVPVASLLPSPITAEMPIPPIPSTAKRKTASSQAKKRFNLHTRPYRRPLPNDPPSPPTHGMPPYRIMSQADFMAMQITTDGKKIQLGWRKRHSVQRVTRPKGTKGKYIRLVSLPAPEDEKVDENDDNLITVKRGKILPKIQVNNNDRDDEDESDEDDRDRNERLYVPTVFMTEIVAAQFNMPVACMMWPPPPVSSLNSRTSKAARRLTKRLSSQSIASASNPPSSPNQEQVQSIPSLAYQFPLVSLTPTQRASLTAAGLLVYAVPRGYQGPIPPPELDVVNDEENKVVAPWNRDALLSPRVSMETGPSSPRWAVESVWNSKGKDKAKGLTVNTGADSNRTSVSSVKSGMTDGMSDIPPVPPIPAIFARGGPDSSLAEMSRSASASTATGGWSSSFSSLRTKAQGYYAASANSTSASDLNALPKSQHSLQESQSSIHPINDPSAPITSGGTISTSRSFGSFFNRVTAATTSTNISALSPGERVPDSGYASSVGVDTPGEGDKGDGNNNRLRSSTGDVLFDGDRDSNRESSKLNRPPQTAPPTITTTSTITTTTAAAPPAPPVKSWKNWAGRWGS